MTACACGCGETVTPGRQWRRGHASKVRARRDPNLGEMKRCPECSSMVRLRADGSFGLHWQNSRKTERFRCPVGGVPGLNVARLKGRRVTVSVDVVIPRDWSTSAYRAEAARVLREHAVEGFVVSVDVTDEDDEAEAAS